MSDFDTPSKRGQVDAFRAMEILMTANRIEEGGRKVIRMEAGQPSAPTPSRVREAGASASEAGRIAYTDTFGYWALRERIAADYAERYGVAVEPERVAVVTGSSAAFALVFLAAFDPGDRVALLAPGYPAYRNILSALEIQPVDLMTMSSTGWLPTAAAIEALHAQTPLKGLLVASPSNPTGAIADEVRLAELLAVCKRLGIRFISDEIYHRLEYGTPAPTAAVDPDAIVINSFSKYFCMTGWRIGWMLLPELLIDTATRLAQNLYICPPDISQQAALAAFDCIEELETVKSGYRTNRDLLTEALPGLGFSGPGDINGGLYAYVGIERFSNDSETFAKRLLDEAAVAVTPGTDFDPVNGHNYVRMSFCIDHSDVNEGLDRMAGWLNGR